MQCILAKTAPCYCKQPSQATQLSTAVQTPTSGPKRQRVRPVWCSSCAEQPAWGSVQLTSPAAAARQQWGLAVRRGDWLQRQAGPIDAAPTWTLDQIAGLAFGVLMVVFYFSANAVDLWVAKQQRRELGLCEECGGVYDAATCIKANCPVKQRGN